MTTLYFLIFIAMALAAFAAGMMYREVLELRQRVNELEQSGPKRLPHKAAESIEDATAALIRLQSELDFRRDLIDNAMAHLQKARETKSR